MSQPNQNSHFVVRRLIVPFCRPPFNCRTCFVVCINNPRKPDCMVNRRPLYPIFTIKSFAVSNFTPSADSGINADYDIQLSIANPNKKVSLVIDDFDIVLLYKAETISTKFTSMEAVYLDKMGTQNRSLRFSRDFSHPLLRSDVKSMSNDLRKRVVKSHVRMKIRTRFGSGILITNRSRMKVSCMNLVVEFSTAKQTGKLKGGRKFCLV